MDQAGDGSLLIGTELGLLVFKDGRVQKTIGDEAVFSQTLITDIEVLEGGRILIGTDGGGIYVSDGDELSHLGRSDGLTSDMIVRIMEDEARSVVWIITSNSIEYMKDGIIYKVEHFPYTDNYEMFFDEYDRAWVLSSNGIYVADADDILSGDPFEYTFYGIADGLPSVPNDGGRSFLDDNGDLYIAGRKGVGLVNINERGQSGDKIRFAVPYIEYDGQICYPNEEGEFELPANASQITVYCHALTYLMHDPLISFCLGGSDAEPTVLRKSDMMPVRYTNIKGGDYEFTLSLLDDRDHSVKQTVSYRITKKYSFYERRWFQILLVALAFLLTAAVFAYALHRKNVVLRRKEMEQQKQKRLFEQTATALVNAIDAKDKYTHGHSSRVAEYSKKIAEKVGKSEEECNEIYYAALLHDVGKIGVPDYIINKDGRLNDEEYAFIKQHPVFGTQILGSISEYPYLSIGAHFHHERYDGHGYPDGLKGTDIPEIARIVSVADSYDAMTSRRSYRDAIPQQKVREELVKGAGTQFDPEYARIMVHLIDMDTEYRMKEMAEAKELGGKRELICVKYFDSVSEGILITPNATTIQLKVSALKKGQSYTPSMILFDSLDGHFHKEEKEIKDLLYFEYARVGFDGNTVLAGGRKSEVTGKGKGDKSLRSGEYRIEAVRWHDHVRVSITDAYQAKEVTLALADSSRFAYLALTGEHCIISDVAIAKNEKPITENEIKRIAAEVSYIDGPAGDIPNLQVDGYRANHTEGIPIRDGMVIGFHARSLPAAGFVSHSPSINLFTSEDGKAFGNGYRDLTLIRLDGECWEGDPGCKLSLNVNRSSSFEGWDAWKVYNKSGYDCEVKFSRAGNTVTVQIENFGISIRSVSKVEDLAGELFASLTGDQCAITNIKIKQEKGE